ncbi:hypothetical protein QAD02_004554 [Eretmocerus hayati]|uniref:Uncharacterized protein n=1 Tax=Eretmocerus hayati TaxID=131215 RepID=A0ACC2NQA4_9HYME|nr:hypothetical protein QAD02_004554 [Eretmocerus hayati]
MVKGVGRMELLITTKKNKGKVWIGENEMSWRTEQSLKRCSPPSIQSATTNMTTTTTTASCVEGSGSHHPRLSPNSITPTNNPDLRSPSSVQVKHLRASPGNLLKKSEANPLVLLKQTLPAPPDTMC